MLSFSSDEGSQVSSDPEIISYAEFGTKVEKCLSEIEGQRVVKLIRII